VAMVASAMTLDPCWVLSGCLSFGIVHMGPAARRARLTLVHHSFRKFHRSRSGTQHLKPGHSDEIHSRLVGATQYKLLHRTNNLRI
jgi:hypothetical protein